MILLVAAICHDTGHDGFNNIYNVKAQTPLGILYKDTSVMESHHCEHAIEILSADETNVFNSFHEDQMASVWNLLVQLILATDMAFHFSLLKQSKEMLDENQFDFKNEDCRILSLKLLLKTGDISNVSRPFNIADKWCDVLNEEFFRQGDNEIKLGIGFTSPLNDRNHSNKPNSQIGFYNFICIPLYQTMAKLFPPLVVSLESLESNLEVWKKLLTESNAQ